MNECTEANSTLNLWILFINDQFDVLSHHRQTNGKKYAGKASTDTDDLEFSLLEQFLTRFESP